MAKINPYAAVMTVAKFVGYSFVGLLALLVLVLLIGSAIASWGWWALLWIPLTVIGSAVAITVLVLICVFLDDTLPSWLRSKKYEWDRRNR